MNQFKKLSLLVFVICSVFCQSVFANRIEDIAKEIHAREADILSMIYPPTPELVRQFMISQAAEKYRLSSNEQEALKLELAKPPAPVSGVGAGIAAPAVEKTRILDMGKEPPNGRPAELCLVNQVGRAVYWDTSYLSRDGRMNENQTICIPIDKAQSDASVYTSLSPERIVMNRFGSVPRFRLVNFDHDFERGIFRSSRKEVMRGRPVEDQEFAAHLWFIPTNKINRSQIWFALRPNLSAAAGSQILAVPLDGPPSKARARSEGELHGLKVHLTAPASFFARPEVEFRYKASYRQSTRPPEEGGIDQYKSAAVPLFRHGRDAPRQLDTIVFTSRSGSVQPIHFVRANEAGESKEGGAKVVVIDNIKSDALYFEIVPNPGAGANPTFIVREKGSAESGGTMGPGGGPSASEGVAAGAGAQVHGKAVVAKPIVVRAFGRSFEAGLHEVQQSQNLERELGIPDKVALKALIMAQYLKEDVIKLIQNGQYAAKQFGGKYSLRQVLKIADNYLPNKPMPSEAWRIEQFTRQMAACAQGVADLKHIYSTTITEEDAIDVWLIAGQLGMEAYSVYYDILEYRRTRGVTDRGTAEAKGMSVVEYEADKIWPLLSIDDIY